MRWIITALGTAFVCTATPASAGIYADDLSRCLVSNTSAEDRIAFTRWMFSAMSAHGEVAALSSVSEADRADFSRETAQLFQRLLLQDCRAQAVAALRYEGQATLAASFEVVGRVAMAELMGDPAVAAQLEALDDHLDVARWEELASEVAPSAGAPPPGDH